MKKILYLFLLICICFFSSKAHTYAAMTNASPQYIQIHNVTSKVTLDRSTACCSTKVVLLHRGTIKITMHLQKKSGEKWSNIKSWTNTKENTISFLLEKKHTISQSGTYRIQSVINGNGENIIKNSVPVTY